MSRAVAFLILIFSVFILIASVSSSSKASAPIKIDRTQKALEQQGELIWLGSAPNVTQRPFGMCGTGLPQFHAYRKSGLVINESGEIVHKVPGMATEPGSPNAVHLGWGSSYVHPANDPALTGVMIYGHINDGTPVKWVLLNEQGVEFAFHSSTGPEALGNGWFRCKVTMNHSSFGGSDRDERPSEVFFVSPELQRIDSIETSLGIKFEVDRNWERQSDQLSMVGDDYLVVVDSSRISHSQVYRSDDPDLKRKLKAASVRAKVHTGFISLATGKKSTHRCSYVVSGTSFFRIHKALITSDNSVQSLYDPVNDVVLFSAYRIIDSLNPEFFLVIQSYGDKQYTLVNRSGEVLGVLDENIRVDHMTQDGVLEYAISDPDLSFNHDNLYANLTFNNDDGVHFHPLNAAWFANFGRSTHPARYCAQLIQSEGDVAQYPYKNVVLNASLETMHEFAEDEYPMYMTQSEKVLTYTVQSDTFTLYEADGQVIGSYIVSNELE